MYNEIFGVATFLVTFILMANRIMMLENSTYSVISPEEQRHCYGKIAH